MSQVHTGRQVEALHPSATYKEERTFFVNLIHTFSLTSNGFSHLADESRWCSKAADAEDVQGPGVVGSNEQVQVLPVLCYTS